MDIRVSPRFKKSYQKLPSKIKDRALNREKIFQKDPFDPILKTHKLHGKYKEAWAYSVDSNYRILFIFINHNTVLYLDIGTHEIYR